MRLKCKSLYHYPTYSVIILEMYQPGYCEGRCDEGVGYDTRGVMTVEAGRETKGDGYNAKKGKINVVVTP